MKSTVYRIKGLVEAFGALSDNKGENRKAEKLHITDVDRAPGSGQAADLIAHHQGMCKLDGNENFIVTGSVKENISYFYICKNMKGGKCCNGFDIDSKPFKNRDYYQIPNKEFTHPSGIQAANNLLVIGMEKYRGATTLQDRSFIHFFDIADETQVKEIERLRIKRESAEDIASAIGLTYRSGQYVMAVRAKNTIDFYTCNDILNGQFSLANKINIKDNHLGAFQCVNLLLDEKDQLYLIGMPDGSTTEDKCWLYHLSITEKNGSITSVNSATQVKCIHFYSNGTYCHFKWSGCVSFVPEIIDADGITASGKLFVFSSSAHVDSKNIELNRWGAAK